MEIRTFHCPVILPKGFITLQIEMSNEVIENEGIL